MPSASASSSTSSPRRGLALVRALYLSIYLLCFVYFLGLILLILDRVGSCIRKAVSCLGDVRVLVNWGD